MSSLVTVVVASYNSSQFIVETLESVSKQTFKAIELIITDDCSGDDTVSICRKWIEENKQRFVNIEIITSDKNTGIPANANRGLNIAKGNWLKFIGADDTLKPTCIEENMSWISSHKEVRALFSRIEIYKDTFEPENLLEIIPGTPYNPKGILTLSRNAESQYKMLLLSDRVHFTPSSFLHRETILSIGAFDERYKMLEDYPLWLNLTRNGHKLYFMDKITVNYRRHSGAVNNTGISFLINPIYFRLEDFRKIYTYPYLPAEFRMYAQFYWCASQIFRSPKLNRNKKWNRLLLELLTVYMNPFKYYIEIKKRLIKNLKDNIFYE